MERMNQINKLHEEAVSEEKSLVCVVQVASMHAMASAACTLSCKASREDCVCMRGQ